MSNSMSAVKTFREMVEPKLLTNRHITESGCWLWTGGRTTHGYGITNYQRKQVRVHRAAHELWKGPIPDGMELDHLCRARACFNPDHLECVTSRENTLRGQGPSARAAKATHCPSGHAYDESNTYLSRVGKRVCKTCRAKQNRDYRARQAKATGGAA